MRTDGIDLPDLLTGLPADLPLRGAGARKVLFFTPYVVAFYSRVAYADAPSVITSDGPKCIRLVVMTDMITGPLLVKGLKDGLDRTKYAEAAEVAAAVERLLQELEGWKIRKGDVAHIFHSEDGAVRLYHGTELQMEEKAEGLPEAMFGIWFSDAFPDRGLQRKLISK